MEFRLYYTTKDGKPRHVVAAEGNDDSDSNEVEVRYLGIHPQVEGKARAGRPPTATKYKMSELTPLEEEYKQNYLPKAEAAWGMAAFNDDSN